ncbi:MAG: cytochrome c3 family protein [Candidatus Wallbacteria bacterium]|nr:cytochrome c3 family protein [Candidatus Wallbacteria bacterium]
MKRTVWIAGLLGLLVLGGYAALVVTTRSSAGAHADAAATVQGVRFVPPMEWIEQRSRQRSEVSSASARAIHVKAAAPKVRIFQTGYKGGTQVVFDHEKHVKDLGLECIECHHVERCSKCHLDDRENAMAVTRGKQALHESCLPCHAASGAPQKCDECHRQ